MKEKSQPSVLSTIHPFRECKGTKNYGAGVLGVLEQFR